MIVGTDPSTTNTTTTVTVGVIPIIMVYGPTNGNKTFDPSTPYFKTFSTTQMVLNSPMFKGNEFDFNQGGTDLGKTQYIDAYERGNFWGSIQTNTKYHLLLKTVLGPAQTFNVPASVGRVTNSGFAPNPVGTADINWFDQQLQGVINKFSQIQPNVLPLFITYNVYLTSGGCCIGGYHSANGPQPGGQTYSYSTVVDQFTNGRAAFAQDIGALAHELGEWTLDPFVNNPSPCPSNGILENGDPLENGPNFGDYPYTIDGFTFHPQDLVFITWFGAPPATSLNVWNGVPTNVVGSMTRSRKHVGQRAAEALQQAECQQVHAHVVVFEVGAGGLQLAALALAAVVGAGAGLAVVIDLVGLAPQLALPLARQVQEMAPGDAGVVRAREPRALDRVADRLVDAAIRPSVDGEAGQEAKVALGDAKVISGRAVSPHSATMRPPFEDHAGRPAARDHGPTISLQGPVSSTRRCRHSGRPDSRSCAARGFAG